MSDTNTIVIEGILGANVKVVSDNLVTFDIASKNRRVKGDTVTTTTTWMECKTFNGFGQLLAKKLAGGDRVTVSGSLEMREHEGRRYYAILCNNVSGEFQFRTDEQGAAAQASFLAKKAGGSNVQTETIDVGATVDAEVEAPVAEATPAAAAVASDDIPF
jgi:single-stranded DNA-binding protein